MIAPKNILATLSSTIRTVVLSWGNLIRASISDSLGACEIAVRFSALEISRVWFKGIFFAIEGECVVRTTQMPFSGLPPFPRTHSLA
jgi:hypothetical protein